MAWVRSDDCEAGACIEVAPVFIESTYCDTGACGCLKDVHGDGIEGKVELEHLPDGGVAIFLSTNPGVKLRYTKEEWDAFVKGARRGQFDFPNLIAAQV